MKPAPSTNGPRAKHRPCPSAARSKRIGTSLLLWLGHLSLLRTAADPTTCSCLAKRLSCVAIAALVASLLNVPALAQEELAIALNANREFELPEGSEVEEVFLLESVVDGHFRPGFAGDGGQALGALLANPSYLAVDNSGSVYVADTGNSRIRKIDTSGAISTFAGSGGRGYGGDGGVASRALLNGPGGLAIDASGNVYVADTVNHRVRRIDATGIIATIAGTGEQGYAGDGGPATDALLNNPTGLAVDALGNVYVADTGNHRVRRINVTGTIATIAGTGEQGYGGDGGPATEALLEEVRAVAVDAQGTVFVASTSRIRTIDGRGTIDTLVGEGGSDLAVDAQGTVYLAAGTTIRRIDDQGTISTFAGTGDAIAYHLWESGRAAETPLSNAVGLAVGNQGKLYVTDLGNQAVRVVRPAFQITVQLGDSDESIALEVSADGVLKRRGEPLTKGSLVTDSSGNSYALAKNADSGIIATYAPPLAIPVLANGELELPPGADAEPIFFIESFAGTGRMGHDGDGSPAFNAQFQFPHDLELDTAGNLLVADSRIRRIDAAGVVTAFAGTTGPAGYSGDGGPAVEAQLQSPNGVAVDASGNVYVADSGNHRIRRISAAGVITTIAGTDDRGRSGDSGPAAEAQPNTPAGVAADAAGNLHVTDTGNRPMRKVNAVRVIHQTGGYSGDGGPAVEARLHTPTGVAADGAGNLYVTDTGNRRIRKIDAAGVITTIAGTGVEGYSGDGGPAAEARLNPTGGVIADASGNVFVADTWNYRIRKIDPAGIITTIAGTGERGYSGDGGLATEAQFFQIERFAADADGNLYISEGAHHRIRRIDTDGVITAIAGTGKREYSGDGGIATAAGLAVPRGLAVDADGNVYVADAGNHRIRVMRPRVQIAVPLGSSGDSVRLVVSEGGGVLWRGAEVVSGTRVTAGNGYVYSLAQGADGGVFATYLPLSQSIELGGGTRITLTRDEAGTWRSGTQVVENSYRHPGDGREYLLGFADGQWSRALYTIRTVAGSDKVVDETSASTARLFSPCDIAFDGLGNAYIGDSGNRRVRKIDAVSGLITTYAGTGNWAFSEDGGLAAETAMYVCSLAVDAQSNVYVADGYRVRRIDTAGTVTTYAGTGELGYAGDGGPATEAQLGEIAAIAADGAGNVYVADSGNHLVRRIDPAGVITTYAGTGRRGYSGDGWLATQARLSSPCGVEVDASGSVYVADSDNYRVRRIDSAGMITTYAGTGRRGYSGDGGAASEAQLSSPCGVAADASGRLHVADSGNHRVRRIDSAGVITTYAGTGRQGYSGDSGAATEAQLSSPYGVEVDTSGNVYVADRNNHRVRRIDPAGTITTFAGTGQPFDRGDGGLAVDGRFDLLGGVAVDTVGNVYVADRGDHRVRRIASAGMIDTLAGTGEPGYAGDGGLATEARLRSPYGVAVDPSGYVFVADSLNHAVRVIDPAGAITTAAGTGRRGRESLPDGIVPESGTSDLQLASPLGITVDATGQVYVSDTFNKRIVRVYSSGLPNVAVGNLPAADLRNSPRPYSLAAFEDGSIIVSDGARLLESKVGDARLLSHLEQSPLLENEATVTGLAVDESPDVPLLYVADSRRILSIADGSVTTIVERRAEGGFHGDGGPAIGAGFSVGGIAVDRSGNIWFTDPDSRRVRVLEPTSGDNQE